MPVHKVPAAIADLELSVKNQNLNTVTCIQSACNMLINCILKTTRKFEVPRQRVSTDDKLSVKTKTLIERRMHLISKAVCEFNY